MAFIDKCSWAFRRVREWMYLSGQETPSNPTLPSEDVVRLRIKLLLEELQELVTATKGELTFHEQRIDLRHLTVSFAGRPSTLVNVADALADINFVLLGTMVAFGMPDQVLMEEVCGNNDFKVGHPDYPSTKDDFGKVVKHPNIPKPNFSRVLALAFLDQE